MKKATQELFGLFSQTLPFFLVRTALLTVFNIFSLIGLALLLILFQNIGTHDAVLTVFILTASLGVFWFVARFFKERVLLRYKASFLAYLARLVRLQGNMAMDNPQIKTGISLVQAKCQSSSGCSQMLMEVRKAFIKLLPPRIKEKKATPLSRLLICAGRPYLEGSVLGFCFDRENGSFSDSLRRASAFFWQEAHGLIPHMIKLGWANILGFFICFIIILIPVGLLFLQFSAPLSIAIGLSLFQALILKQAFLFPFIQSSMSLRYQDTVQGQAIAPDTEKTIQSLLG